jgi:hypothetical protein
MYSLNKIQETAENNEGCSFSEVAGAQIHTLTHTHTCIRICKVQYRVYISSSPTPIPFPINAVYFRKLEPG